MGGGVAGEEVVVIDVAGEDHLRGGEAFPVGEGLERVEVGPPPGKLARRAAAARPGEMKRFQ